MKKGFLAILTVLTVFALVMTGCPTPTSTKTPMLYTVSFDGNGQTSAASTVPDDITQSSKGAAIKLPTGSNLAKTGFTFGGWLDEDEGEVYAGGDDYTPTADVTLKAVWTPSGGGTLFTVSFNSNGGSGTQTAITQSAAGAAITLPVTTTFTAPTGKTFDGWSESATGAKITTDTITPTADKTLYAVWAAGGGQPTELIEKVTLSNASQVVYRFDPPSGKKWSDYEKITADYMLETDAEFEVANSGRTIRLYGNYAMDFFQFNTTTAGNKYAYASLDGSANNNEYIMDQPGGGWMTLSTALTDILGECPEGGEWFTIDYLLDGSRANVKPHKHLPADSDTGPFIFGLGLAGQDDKNTQFIRNVLLKGKTGTSDLLAKPLFITKDGYDYPAFSAYGTADGNGVDNITRTASQGTYPPAWPAVAPPTVTVTFNLNKPTGAIAEPVFDAAFTGTKTFDKGSAIGTLPTATLTDYTFGGWAETATGTTAIATTKTYGDDATVYAIWLTAGAANTITFNLAGGTGPTIEPVVFAQGETLKLTAVQLTKPAALVVSGKTFGGWYTTDTTAGTFDYKDYTKLVSINTEFTADATLYAYWYTPGSTVVTPTGTYTDDITVEAQGGGRIDADGFVIMVGNSSTPSATTSYLGGGYDGDTLLTFKLPAAADVGATSTEKIKITYQVVEILQPAMTQAEIDGGYEVSTGYIWKNGYGSWDGSTTAGNPGSYGAFDVAGGDLERDLKFFEKVLNGDKGVAIQINKGDDTTNKNKRVGYVYGIKVTAIAFE